MKKKAAAATAAVIVCAGLAVGGYFLWDSGVLKPADGENAGSTTPVVEPGAAGGNSGIAGHIEITVSEDRYFYDNREISYDDLIKMLDGLDGNTAVTVNDDNAALNVFEKLTKALEEREIPYELAE